MFSSADGYCSAAVFSDGELGIKYEKQPEPVEEYDVEMMDMATTQLNAEPIIQSEVSQLYKKRVSMSPTDPIVTGTVMIEKPKKRRITPILISTPLQTPTTTTNTNTAAANTTESK